VREPMQRLGRIALVSWGIASALLLLALVAVLLRHGMPGFYVFQTEGHGSSLRINFAAFAISWCAIGAAAALSQAPARARRHALFWVVLALVSFRWLNDVREPHRVRIGDFGAYFEAAKAMHAGAPIAQLPDRLYLYPPLLATAMSPLVPLGEELVREGFELVNWGVVVALACLLYAALPRYGATRGEAALAVGLLFFVNVPVLRSLAYHQVNPAVETLVVASLLAWPRFRAASALALALAVHVKVYPVLLVLPFLAVRDGRWIGWFVLWNLAIVAGTSALTGFHRYPAFLEQVWHLEETALRNASIDAFLHNTLRVAGAEPGALARGAGLVLRAASGAAFLLAIARLAGRARLGAGRGRGDAEAVRAERLVAHGFALLPLVMLIVSPSIWEHHPMLLSLTMPVLAGVLARPREAWLFLPAYAFLFWMPVVDIYPVSGLRLLAFFLLLALLFELARRPDDPPPAWRARLARRLEIAAPGHEHPTHAGGGGAGRADLR